MTAPARTHPTTSPQAGVSFWIAVPPAWLIRNSSVSPTTRPDALTERAGREVKGGEMLPIRMALQGRAEGCEPFERKGPRAKVRQNRVERHAGVTLR